MNKIILTLAIAAISNGAQAELKVLDDNTMSEMTGQAGLTIELSDVNVTIGEIAYKDGGYIFMGETALGGAGLAQTKNGQAVTHGMMLDNIKLTIDVAGDASDSAALQSAWGLSKLTSPSLVASGNNQGTHGETAVTIKDGDLVVGIDAISQAELIDFGAYTDRVSLGASTLLAGDGASNPGTTLMSDVVISGYVGPVDIVIDGSSNNLNINSYLEVTNGKATMDFLGTSFDFKIHNRRGNDVLVYDNTITGESVSFFHAQMDIGANPSINKGLMVNITDASGDMDLTNITFGSAPTIGDVYITDLSLQAKLDVYGH